MQRRKLGVYIPRMDDNCQRIMRGVVRHLHEQAMRFGAMRFGVNS